MDKVTVRSMNGGNGLNSYTQNSTFQRKIIESAKELINKAVEKLETHTLLSSRYIKIADLGCSTGPNTFLAVETIIDSLEHKLCNERGQHNLYKSEVNIPEFQVFFNDKASNDFNQLFASLPRDKKYFAAGVPGSFHERLFPKDSLHFVHSSCAVHWLSRVPEEVVVKSSPARNKGRIIYSNSSDHVVRAHEAQFAKDLDTFLKFRAQEIVQGGLMAIITYGRSNGSSHSKSYVNKICEQVEHVLVNMAKEGKVSDEKIDSFNMQMYLASPEEVESVVKRNGCFNLETLEVVPQEMPPPNVMSSVLRAVYERMIKEHFGDEISDELFGTALQKKLDELYAVSESFESNFLFVLLKCVKK